MELLSYGFMQRALIAATAVGLVAPAVGVFIVQRRQALIGDGMGHVAFAGVGLAFLVGVQPLAGALVLAVVAALALHRMQRSGLGGDVALALTFYGGIALGFLFAARAGVGVNAVLGLLFGSPLNLSWSHVAAIVALAGVVAVIVVALYQPLVAVAFDEAAARVAGVPVEGLITALTLIVALIVVGGMYAIGLLLVSSMMVIPVAAASQLASSYRTTMLLASAIGAASAIIGLLLAGTFDLTPGASIVLTGLALHIAATLVGRLRGVDRRVHAPAGAS